MTALLRLPRALPITVYDIPEHPKTNEKSATSQSRPTNMNPAQKCDDPDAKEVRAEITAFIVVLFLPKAICALGPGYGRQAFLYRLLLISSVSFFRRGGGVVVLHIGEQQPPPPPPHPSIAGVC